MTARRSARFDEGNAQMLASLSGRRLLDVQRPSVSVIIPVYNQWSVTARCLMSLLDCDWDVPIQVIVVDDGSSDETPDMLHQLPGIDVLRNGVNVGFLRSCNRGATIATGQYILFLNNDTEVADGALRWLVARIESDPSIGIVGSKLVYPDGRLQEAGGIIWADASGWNFGRLDKADRAIYGFLRDVDYVSGASLLIRTKVFSELGGFDERYAPAYYEDADLCFAVRAHGLRVVYEPQSIVTHYEGISSGTDLSSGTKKFQEINKPKFRAKWAQVLDSEHLLPDAARVARAARMRGRKSRSILIVDSYVPLHDREAGSNRLQHLVTGFAENGYHVVFFPDNGLAMEPYASALQQRGIELSYVEHEDPRDWKMRFIDALAGIDAVWICRPHLCAKYLPLVRKFSSAPVLYDTIDLHHERMRREARLAQSSNDEAWIRMRDLEFTCAMAADATIVVTASEEETLHRAEVDPIAVVPTIHDFEASGTYGFDLTTGLLFIGGYNHTPNVDAALWLVEEIMPLVWKANPRVTLMLLGSSPPERVSALAGDRVTVPGYIPDVSPYFRRARLFVAPLRYGAGVNGKIGHALTFGIPIVTTPIGASGFGLTNAVTAMVAENAETFAEAIVSLYSDAELWDSISQASAHCLEPFNSVNAVKSALRIVETALSQRRMRVESPSNEDLG